MEKLLNKVRKNKKYLLRKALVLNMRKIVTSYIKPDIDGISSMYAYTEYLRKKGFEAEYYYEGTARKEVEIVLATYNINLKNINKIKEDDEVILVDTNGLKGLPNAINESQIKEVIDHHRKTNWLSKQKGVKVQIELIGAAATLIAEKFKNDKINISKESAILLYNGIISNTMNLKISMTSEKDKEMAKWLKKQCKEITDKKTKIATIPVGYADGIRRSLSNNGKVYINGKYANIIGNVCMDNFMVDVTNIENIKIGDEVILWDNENITVEEVAKECDTINYEILCNISKRIPRKYV